MTRREIAEKYFIEGYNCAQAVALAFADRLDIGKDQLLKVASSFGGGLGRMREVCGAVSGMAIVAGALNGYSDPCDRAKKTEHYALIQDLVARFRDKNGSYICRELLGAKSAAASPVPDERTPEYYKTRPCAKLVGDCAEILEKQFDVETL